MAQVENYSLFGRFAQFHINMTDKKNGPTGKRLRLDSFAFLDLYDDDKKVTDAVEMLDQMLPDHLENPAKLPLIQERFERVPAGTLALAFAHTDLEPTTVAYALEFDGNIEAIRTTANLLMTARNIGSKAVGLQTAYVDLARTYILSEPSHSA